MYTQKPFGRNSQEDEVFLRNDGHWSHQEEVSTALKGSHNETLVNWQNDYANFHAGSYASVETSLEKDYMLSAGKPRDLLFPHLEEELQGDLGQCLNDVSLHDIDAPLHSFGGDIDIHAYLGDKMHIHNNMEQTRFFFSDEHDSSFGSYGDKNICLNQDSSASSVNNSVCPNHLSYDNGTHQYTDSGYLQLWNGYQDSSNDLNCYNDIPLNTQRICPIQNTLSGGYPSSSQYTTPELASNPASDAITYNQYGSSCPVLRTSPSAEATNHFLTNEADAAVSKSSRKGYKHRHARRHGLSEEERKNRNQRLNNEASVVYRENRSKKIKDIEENLRLEEDRNARLRHQKQTLDHDIAVCTNMLKLQKLLP
ncbi:hypothetical protein SK128_001495 [Halocaridina rubra]|uniref:BZIP domain-containing protein n=1 Tax=Halocaridina rubra TaxID=373956 RepID=A0AAN8X2D6_HALRR